MTSTESRTYGPEQFVNEYGIPAGDYPTITAEQAQVGDHVQFGRYFTGTVLSVAAGKRGQTVIGYRSDSNSGMSGLTVTKRNTTRLALLSVLPVRTY